MIDRDHRAAPSGFGHQTARPQVSLAEFHNEWWDLYAAPNLSPKTLELYRYLWRAQIERELGQRPLRSMTPLEIERWKLDRLRRGVGPETIRRTLTMLQGI